MGIEKEEKTTVSFGYNNLSMALLDWDIRKPMEDYSALEWSVEFELMVDMNTDKGYSAATFDSAFYLGNQNDYAALVKTRNIFSISPSENEKYEDVVIAFIMDVAVAHSRALCWVKGEETKTRLPIIPFFTSEQLTNKASLILLKPALQDFTYERKAIQKKIAAPKPYENIAITVIGKRINIFEPLPPTHISSMIANIGEGDDMQASMSFNYDFEVDKKNKWKVHLDTGLKILPVAEIKFRTSFSVICPETTLFTLDIFNLLVEESLATMNKAFTDQCIAQGVNFTGTIPVNKELVEQHSSNAIDQYFTARKSDYEKNRELLKPGLSLTVGGNTLLIVKGTFIILDEILFLNNAFDHAYNWESLEQSSLYESMYFTLRHNSLELENGPIKFTLLHSIFLIICIDIALQMLLSDHGDTLQPALLKMNFIPFRQQEFLKFGNDLITHMNESLKKSKARISNLEERKDWASIIR